MMKLAEAGIVMAVAALTATTGLAMTNPDASGLEVWGVHGGPAGGTPETSWYDYLGNPIATMGQSGGFKVFGDEICAYPPGNVFVPAACLQDNGTVLVGGRTLTPADVNWIHSAEATSR